MTDNVFYKNSVNGVLDYKFDLKGLTHGEPGAKSDYLQGSELILTHTITVPTGITVDSSAQTDTNTSITVWLSGGVFGQRYLVKCEWVTDDGRTDEDQIYIVIGNPR